MVKKINIDCGRLSLVNVRLEYDGYEINIFKGSEHISYLDPKHSRLKFMCTTETSNWYEIVSKNN